MAGYGDDDGFNSWLADNGYTLPEGAPSVGVLRQRGSDYIDGTFGGDFSGQPTGGFGQERAWPRTGARAHFQSVPTDLVPDPIIKASYAASWYEANNTGGLAAAVVAAQQVKSEQVDVLKTEYFAGSGDAVANATVRLSAVEGLVKPFLYVIPTNPVSIFALGC
jgi:hypothetical protein